MSKLLNSPSIPQEILIQLNLVVYFIKACISYGQKKFIKTVVENFLTKLFCYSPAAVLQYTCSSVTSLFPTSFLLFSDEVHGCPYRPRKKKGNDESKIYNRPFLQEILNLHPPTQATENCIATNGLSFNLSSRTYYFLFSYNGLYSEILCLAGYFCFLVL